MKITDEIMSAVVSGSAFKWCPQGCHVVMQDDFDPRAGMCGACISEAMADAGDYFSRRGLVASIEEEAHND